MRIAAFAPGGGCGWSSASCCSGCSTSANYFDEKWHDGHGIMMDEVVAGLYAGFALLILGGLFQQRVVEA